MAAQNDKISENRRRLFKALSAVPVVSTLRPGSALANASAFQCLDNIAPTSTDRFFYPETTAQSSTCGAFPCFVYRERDYWIPQEGNATGNADSCSDLAAAVIVRTDPDIEAFFTLNGDDVTSRVSRNTNTNSLQVNNLDNDPCYNNVPAKKGLFLLVGQPNDGQTFFSDVGTYPETQLVGTNQGITESCMNSVPNDITGVIGVAQG